MKTRSAKAKGRRLQKWAAKKISKVTGFSYGKDAVIASRESSQSGPDVRIVGSARKVFPMAVECKYQETWSIPKWVSQAKKNMERDHLSWVLFVKKNKSKIYKHGELAIIDARLFFDLWEGLYNVEDLWDLKGEWEDEK